MNMNAENQLPLLNSEDKAPEFWVTRDLIDVFDPEKRRLVVFPTFSYRRKLSRFEEPKVSLNTENP